MDIVRLRGHHLLCILTFIGKGYSPAFVQNLELVIARLHAGVVVKLVWGPDTICAGWLDEPGCHCRQSMRLSWRDVSGFIATSIVLRRPCWPGRMIELSSGDILKMRRAFKLGTSRVACLGCPWFGVCSAVARDDFAKSRLRTD